MGKVKIDINSSEQFYKDLTFSDIEVVTLLVQYRYKYDRNFFSVQNNYFDTAGDISGINKEMINTFASLDRLIDECKFDQDQMFILKGIMRGDTYGEVAKDLGKGNSNTIKGRLKRICERIVKQNEWNWRKIHYVHTLGLKTKQCNKCKSNLPATEEFFYLDDKIADGFFGFCRICK